ncbi:glycosyltransferase [Synechococcus sp. CS-602]|uniref:glycosyltransferase family A protein n=1 Tax=Synechococcaceae TaxID=1890426 RepID=UPI0008FF0748|nr:MULTISPECIES: glycosyltransferase family A protein [Synechococcaceae]MCT4364054.1 glycosyltransferase [Candidatus Regnicoccus frigidus MAG-AL1]MCT0201429.1 glycosyltransferase [Synechococcus sp. CS-603]MCT0205980.1 glycosyltransferase [Synechococcus sp. CS-602]MCT0245167.1 glycosyltransferase [Synechococcus sp. CS-601]MCT4366359.1 glycosyltransferase [Candidatus Regnicoccus frigidus MAG-AL2]
MTVSVITPTRLLPDRLSMLVELNQSLQNNDCVVEHVIVVDGQSGEALPSEIRKTSTVIKTERPIGQAAARNLGLAIARGGWITSADDDDWLYPHSIDKRLAALKGQHGALWSAGYCTDDCKIDPAIVPAGPSSPGDIWRSWPTPKASIPLGPTTLLVDANLLKKAGGWMGLPQGEDIGMMIAVTCMAPGIVIKDYVYHIRLHEGQMTKTKWFDDLELLSRRCAWERGEQIISHTPIGSHPWSGATAPNYSSARKGNQATTAKLLSV